MSIGGFEVLLTEGASQTYAAIRSNADLMAVNRSISALKTLPYIGRSYDPVYEAAKPPFDLLVAYAGHDGIYYVVEEDLRQVHVYFIEDQRRDPMRRFGS